MSPIPLVNGPLFTSHVKRLSDELPVARTVGGTVGRLVGGRVGNGVGCRVGVSVGPAVGATVGVFVGAAMIGTDVSIGWGVTISLGTPVGMGVVGTAVGTIVGRIGGFAVGEIDEGVNVGNVVMIEISKGDWVGEKVDGRGGAFEKIEGGAVIMCVGINVGV